VPAEETGRGCGAVVAGVGVGGAEAFDACCFTEDLCGGERAAARDRKQRGREAGNAVLDLAFQRLDLDRQLAAAFDKLAREAGDESLLCVELGCQPVEGTNASERARGGLERRAELVQVPTQTVDQPCPFGNQVLAVVDE